MRLTKGMGVIHRSGLDERIGGKWEQRGIEKRGITVRQSNNVHTRRRKLHCLT